MRKLALALAMLPMMGGSARAEFAKTLLEANAPVTVEVTGGATSTGETAVTVFFLARRFGFATGSAPPGGAFVLGDQKLTAGSRMIVEIDLPTPNPGSTTEATLTVFQAGGGGPSSGQSCGPSMGKPSDAGSTWIDTR
jgi:hypothetical protein